jgi:diguanylate cyclase (GGDEF)-like protein
MDDSIRVLVVEHSDTGRFLAQQLLDDFDLEFAWESVASEPELRIVAQEFNPTIVLCVDETSTNSSHAALDTLRLLSTQKPVILISEVCTANALGVSNTDIPLRPNRGDLPPDSGARAIPGSRAITGSRSAPTQPAVPKYLPSILESSSAVVVMSDSDGWITYANINACRLLSGSCEQLLVTILGASNNQCLRTPNWLDLKMAPDAASGAGEIAGAAADDAESGYRAHRLGFVDAWTLLPAQAHVNDLICCLTARARGDNNALALVGLNLDGLQLLNENYGRAMGDELLNHVDSVLQSNVTRCGMAVRVGRDDFVVVLPGLSYAADAAITVRGILDSVSQRRVLSELDSRIDENTDLALFSDDAAESASLPRLSAAPVEADSPRWELQDVQPSNDAQQAPRASQAQADLEDAIQRQALSLHYQPQFELLSGRGCGVEVLARWTRANGESMAPAVFIPLAERGGTIRTLGAWVLHCACHTAAAWRGREAERLTLSVNLSNLQIDEQFTPLLAGILKSSNFPAQRLELEISEGAIIANSTQTIRCLREWKRLGVRIAVNHFGTDYSSLSYLSRFKVDRLKLDKSLIHNMTFDHKSAAVMHGVISLGAALGVDVIAEGVETEPQLEMLSELGCPQVQGYLLARPMLATQAQVALRKTWGNLPKSAFRPKQSGGQMYAS